MATKVIGGGSSAVAASTHAACARFRGTDPLVTGVARRKLAEALGHPDISAGIPEARWMRAMTFERLVRDQGFASQTATTTVGALDLARPTEVVIVDARVNADRTAQLLQDAHDRALTDGAATLIHELAVPFVGFEDQSATDVKPDFAVVAPKVDVGGSWLIVGDAKDYERYRSRVEDARLLKGFLQVAVGAESAAAWSKLPADMDVHGYGVLAVPRNSFLQPEALVDDISDHRYEVRMRIAERRREAASTTYAEGQPFDPFVAHLEATFDPGSCPSCSLFNYCRAELRASMNKADVLVEIGVPREVRPQVVGLVDGTCELGRAPASTIANVLATVDGRPRFTNQRRVDPIGLPGTINVVIAKSDAAALGIHGMAIQRVSADGPGEWQQFVYDEPQSPETRRAVIRALGTEVTKGMTDRRKATPGDPDPIHLVVPDKMTADVLVSIADNLAGLELSRLRWARDKQMGRPQLTWAGEPAVVPAKISEADRTAISFLLEQDRARALMLRSPIVNAQQVLSRYVVTGGPRANALRLDYLIAWLVPGGPIKHRDIADEIEALEHTPGARLANTMSNQIHEALSGPKTRQGSRSGVGDPVAYDRLVREELRYKSDVLDATVRALADLPASTLRDAHRAIERAAQVVWRRRLSLRASDLVRFGRTYRRWRNSLVDPIQTDAKCRDQLLALTNPQAANDLATDAGNRSVAYATVVSADPIVLDVESRRFVDGTRIVLLHVNDDACVEDPNIVLADGGGVRLSGLSIGPLTRAGIGKAEPKQRLQWTPQTRPALDAGDRLVIADFSWISTLKGNRILSVPLPAVDSYGAPKATCTHDSYENDPEGHTYCCKPHEVNEAEYSDLLAKRRSAGELNPEAWPPVRDGDAFETAPAGATVGDPFDAPPVTPPADATIDDLD